MKVFGQIEKAQLENTTSDTGSLPKGMITYRTDLNLAKVSNGTLMKALIDEDTAQTLTTKTLATPTVTGAIIGQQIATPSNPSAGYNKLYFKSDSKLYTLDPSGNEALVGSGSGGVKNLITTGNADDTATSIFVTYADAAGTRPVDGTGGSPTVTTAITTTVPLDGTKSFLLTHPASNTQGQGWAVPFTVAPAYFAKALKISADYIVNSGTFVPGSNGVDGDVIWYIYDVTNSQLIEPSNIKMLSNSTTLSDKFEATFQTSATGSSYRLIAHCATTSASAYELKVDNITVSPQTYIYGTPITDPQTFVPSISTGVLGTGGTQLFSWRRNGKMMDIQFTYEPGSAGTAGSGSYVFTIPSGASIDTSFIGANGYIGDGYIYNGSTIETDLVVSYNSATTFVLRYSTSATAMATVGSSNFPLSNSGTRINFKASVPILGWSSSVQTSDQTDTRVVSLRANKSATQVITANSTNITAPNVEKDTHGAWSSDTYTVKVPGDYYISVNNFKDNAGVATIGLEAYVNGSLNSRVGLSISGAGSSGSGLLTDLKTGDLVTVRSTVSITLAASGILAISRISGPSAIAASEEMSVRSTNASGQSIANGVTAIAVTGWTSTYSTHGNFNNTTGVFAPGTAGKFNVNVHFLFNAATFSSGNIVYAAIYKNGSEYSRIAFTIVPFTGSQCIQLIGADDIDLLATDTLDIRLNHGEASARSLLAGSGYNFMSIKKNK